MSFLKLITVHPKPGQKRPATSPVPLLPTHHLQSNHAVNHLVPPSAGPSPTASNQASGSAARGPFASALRNLAKQADIKDDDVTVVSHTPAAGSSGSSIQQQQHQRSGSTLDARNEGRISSGMGGAGDNRNIVDDRIVQKKKAISPQPIPDKVSIYLCS